LAQALLRPQVVQFLDFTTNDFGTDIAIEQVTVASHTAAASKTIKELQLGRNLGVIVMAIRTGDGHMSFNPSADTAIHEGDCLIVMGRQDSLRALEAMVAGK
jgi:voltage-gated potassium channel